MKKDRGYIEGIEAERGIERDALTDETVAYIIERERLERSLRDGGEGSASNVRGEQFSFVWF